MMSSNYGNPLPIVTMSLFLDGQKRQVLDEFLKFDIPVNIFQSGADSEIRSQSLGLSREEDITRIQVASEELSERVQ